MKAIILAGGNGTRLNNFTRYTSKQLLPVYNQPMVFYPFNTLKELGFSEIALISKSEFTGSFWRVFKSEITKYLIQDSPDGLPEAFNIAYQQGFLKEQEGCALILGDNLFFNFVPQIKETLQKSINENKAFISSIRVGSPEKYGVLDIKNNVIVEKPKEYVSDLAIPGFYYFPDDVLSKTRTLKKSERGETEIAHLNNLYLQENKINVLQVFCGWFDCGEYDSLLTASNYVKALSDRGELFC